MASPEKDEFSYEEISAPYYFETDHVALKENTDYRNLLQAIALLEAQRVQAALDLNKLYKAQDEALASPLAFVEKLQRGVDLALPRPQIIASVPVIPWEQYTSSASFHSFGTSHHLTRKKKTGSEIGGDSNVQQLKSTLSKGTLTSAASASATSEQPGSDSDLVVVRGRVKDSLKPASFNQLWSEEEQQRLERLLIQYPPEDIESKRWGKIAAALGNRTPQQVASRVQKYFLRLAKEGLPIPGRMPSFSSISKKGSHRHHRFNRMYYPNSTLMQSHNPPVWMNEDDAEDWESIGGSETGFTEPSRVPYTSVKNEESSDEDNLPEDVINSPEYQELIRLKGMRKKLLAEKQMSLVKHIGYKCDRCGCEPIVGTRWHCIDCPVDISFDFCDGCSDASFQVKTHDSSHRLHPFKNAVLDSDYMSYSNTDYNYLDTNFMPATR